LRWMTCSARESTTARPTRRDTETKGGAVAPPVTCWGTDSADRGCGHTNRRSIHDGIHQPQSMLQDAARFRNTRRDNPSRRNCSQPLAALVELVAPEEGHPLAVLGALPEAAL